MEVGTWLGRQRRRRLEPRFQLGLFCVRQHPQGTAHVGAVMIVHLAFALQLADKQGNAGSFGKMKL